MQNIWQKSDGSIPLYLEVQYNFIPVSGISPTVEIRRFSDDKYADFGSNTFVSTGGNKFGVLTELSGRGGLYKRNFNPVDFGESNNRQLYCMTYRATIPSGFRSDISSDINLITNEVNFFTELAGSGSSFPASMSVSFIS